MHIDLAGKNTLEASSILAGEFVRRFGEAWGTTGEIQKSLMPQGKAPSWSGLDRNINLFCRQFYATWEADADKLGFWDEVRFRLASLPMKRDYKLPEHKAEYSTPQYASQFFVSCSLCWRSVLRKPLEKKTPLCHLHDLPSTHAVYRRQARMKKGAEAIRQKLLKTLPPLTHIKLKQGLNLHSYVKSLCLGESSPLSYLRQYLHSLNMPLESDREVIEALEYPIYWGKISPFVASAWKYYLADRGEHFKLNYIQLLTAEAWLRADSGRQHGGKRR